MTVEVWQVAAGFALLFVQNLAIWHGVYSARRWQRRCEYQFNQAVKLREHVDRFAVGMLKYTEPDCPSTQPEGVGHA